MKASHHAVPLSPPRASASTYHTRAGAGAGAARTAAPANTSVPMSVRSGRRCGVCRSFPGTSLTRHLLLRTERDLVEISRSEDRLYELVDGVLMEKTVGWYESYLAMVLGYRITHHVLANDLGIVLGSDAMTRLAPGLAHISGTVLVFLILRRLVSPGVTLGGVMIFMACSQLRWCYMFILTELPVVVFILLAEF